MAVKETIKTKDEKLESTLKDIEKMFGKGAYYKIFGGNTASLLQVGEFFEKLNNAVDECHEELRKETNMIKAVTNENLI